MFDFGDDLTIAALSVPWLVWIQILILILLLLLLFLFGLFSPDLADAGGGCSSSLVSRTEEEKPASVSSSVDGSVLVNRLPQNSQVGRGTSRRRVCVGLGGGGGGGVEVEDTEGQELKEATPTPTATPQTHNHLPFHPCHYFRLAKLAFLKCLGLDSLRQ